VISFAAPAWLLGLLLVPIIWYLHRSGPSLRRVPVASLEVWRDARVTAADAGRVRRPDPAWRRRAAVAALLSIALAAPQWQQATPRLTVWLDDSLSMRMRDGNVSRLEQGIRLAQAAARKASVRDVVVRPLSDPARSFPSFDGALPELLHGAADASEPRLPPPAALRSDRVYWLVTDGADAAVNAWAAEAPIARVLRVTDRPRNVGVTRLTARAQPTDRGTLALQVQVANGGDGRESRTLELSADASAIGSRSVELDAGESVTLDFTAASAAATVTAMLAPADALTDDDALSVDVATVAPLPVSLAGACPASLVRAVHTHPALEVASDVPPRLVFDCGVAGTRYDVPVVRFVTGPPAALDPAQLTWSSVAGRLREQLAGRLPDRIAGSLASPTAADRVLLSGGSPLIVARGGTPRIVETALDVTAPGFESGPGLPLLVSALADAALDTQLLARIASAGRGEQASRVAPLADPSVVAQPTKYAVATGLSITPLLLLALALLAWDALLASRRLLRERGPTPGRAA